MSVIGGTIDFTSVYRNDYVPKTLDGPLRVPNPLDDNCMIKRAFVDNLSIDAQINPKDPIEHFCKDTKAYYKDSIEKLKEKEEAVGKKYFQKPLIEKHIQYRKEDKVKTIYQDGYCKRDFSYGRSVIDIKDFNVKLKDDHKVPETSTLYAFRNPSSIALRGIERTLSLRPFIDKTLQRKTSEILGTSCGASNYEMSHGILGRAILEAKPYGEPQEAPLDSRWGEPGHYVYRIR